MKEQYILALDQGTSSSRAILYGSDFRPISAAQTEFTQLYPHDGWVEHDPEEIWRTQYDMARQAIAKAGAQPSSVAAIGITNQRETTIVWDKTTGEPVYNAIVWMCRRTAGLCTQLREQGWADVIRKKTGLVVDAYFSGTKVKWILDNVPGARARAKRGELLFGTVDSWLLYRLTGGAVHATDYTNAARTMLFNIHTGEWDDELLRLLDIPACMLPRVLPSSCCFGYTDPALFDGARILVGGIAGDQHASLFGHGCIAPGMAKNTYGTGCFTLVHTGETPLESQHGLLTTIALHLDGKTYYALEGSVFNAGSTIKWLRDELKIISTAAESEALACSVSDTGGVYLVPAFSGLGAPYWDMYARGTLVGMTRSTSRAHIVRAALESIAYQTGDVLRAMEGDLGQCLCSLAVDGGACANNFLMQFQADLLNCNVVRPQNIEVTALGAAYLAGLACGALHSAGEIANLNTPDRTFSPVMHAGQRDVHMRQWQRAVKRSLGWAEA